ncbi:MAG: hypothetical protein KC493_08945 [Bacteriovoracaceae bacterium]|nr:hypothetical protein [Bacteriovoracaceae bacterium]
MILTLVFDFFSNYLIEFMAALLVVGLGFRWASWRSSLQEDSYFSTFTSEIEKVIINQKTDEVEHKEDVDKYIDNLLNQVVEKLPTRAVRSGQVNRNEKKAEKLGAKNVVSLRDYVSGERAFFLAIKQESSSFKSNFPPNFNDLAERIMEKEDKWNKLLGFFPIGPISRLIDILPGLFVVLGIFGTFIGISMALPKIAQMDFNNLEGSGAILTEFVLNVTYAMKTSIAGILFSLVTTLLNAIAPVRGLRMRTFKKVSQCFENIWHSIHGDKSAEIEMKNVFPELLKELKGLREDMNKQIQNDEEEKKGA